MTSSDARDPTKDIVEGVSEGAMRAAETVGRVGADASKRARHAMGNASDTAQGIYEAAVDGVTDLGDRMPAAARDAVEASKRVYQRGSDQVGRQIARQPIEALLLAGAIGYLVGWAANRS